MLLRISTLLFFVACFCQCKKNGTEPELRAPNLQKVQREHGQLLGTAVKQTIGTAGGTITAADGGLAITIPSGAIETATEFSIQPVTNIMGSKGTAYRLLPEGTVFKKPLTLVYSYANAGVRAEEAAYLFLVYQDASGYFYQQKNIQHNAATKTLTVQTKHFSDWTFLNRVELKAEGGTFYNGVVELKKSESVKLTVKKYIAREETNDAYEDGVPLYEDIGFAMLANISWTKTSTNGTLTAETNMATYKAPPSIASEENLLVSVTVSDYGLGNDNTGQTIKQMILSQPVRLVPDGEEFFEVTDGGTKYQLKNPRVSFVPGFVTINGFFPNSNNEIRITLKDATGPGNFFYDMPGLSGKASIDFIATGSNIYVHFRTDDCTNPKDIYYSPGQVSISKLALAVGDFTEGTFSGEVYDVVWCTSGLQKSLSGRFKIEKKF